MSEPNWTDAQKAWEAGATLREVAEIAGVNSPETVRKQALRAGWVRQADAVEAASEERRKATAAATDAARLRWANRRLEEADAAGVTAAVARQRIVKALDGNDEKMVRASAIAYGILIDKAQLLSGDATARYENLTPEQIAARAIEVLDELGARRAARAAS